MDNTMRCVCGKKWVEPSRNSVVEPFGGMHNFLASYGLKPTPDGYEDGKVIIDAMIAQDREAFRMEHQNCR